ncbi:MAG: pyruvate kinase [Solirubrobacteraceae bacterium]|nr:pyruvate kinase [Solirubrobacteraceae bacterium]
MRARRTKILATLGPASDSPEILDAMLAAGLDCVRLNCSHGTADDLRVRTAAVRTAAERVGKPVGLLFDLQGPKLRLSAATPPTQIRPGDEVVFTGSGPHAHATEVVVDYEAFVPLVTERSQLVIGDGLPRFNVESIIGDRITCRAVTAGAMSARKGINVTYARPNLPALTDKDLADLELAVELDADFVALSFVRSAADIADLAERLRELGSNARTVAKIEKIEAYEHLDEILDVADAIMVARGDFGVEAGVARVPLMQKDAIFRATQVGKLVITATQMLESMIHAPEPTRAEVADVANAVIDGTSAVMLSAETGVGEYPVEAVQAMSEIALEAETSPVILGRARGVHPASASATVMHAAVALAHELNAAALVIPTSTGGGARACAKYRPKQAVFALVFDRKVASQLALEWGVEPIMMPVAESVDDLVDMALEIARDEGGLPPGCSVVLTAGRRTGTPGATSLIMVRDIPEPGLRVSSVVSATPRGPEAG